MTSIRATVLGFGSSSEAPVASFITDVSSFSLGGVIRFTNTSVSLISDLWMVQGGLYTFVEGTNENSLNPVIRFWEDVTYTVSLRAWNAYGTDLTSDTYSITPPIPVASFTISDATPNVGQIVTFNDTSTQTPTSWSWAISPSTYVFEGGTSATSQNPQIAFLDESENYTVNLTATNASGSDSTSFTNNVVSNALEAVHFEYDPYLYLDADNEGTQVPTTYGSPTYNAAGYYAFDGTDDAFYYDYDGGINDATGAIEVFVDWDNTQNGAAISWSRDNSTAYRGNFSINSTSNSIQLFLRRAFSGDQINLSWNFSGASGKYHIVINKTADGGTSPSYNYEMYINGVSQGNADSDASTATQGYWFNDVDGFNPYNISVGGIVYGNNSLPTSDFKGDIYRATIYQDALSATRISENYNWLLER